MDRNRVKKQCADLKRRFGTKTIYFDPKNGKYPSYRSLEGVLEILNAREDIENKEQVIKEFKEQAYILLRRLEADGFVYPYIL